MTAKLQALGYDADLLVPEYNDVSLRERCWRVNNWCPIHGSKHRICVSIHFNAYGNGSEWTSPSGWSIFTSKGNTAADRLATCIAEAANEQLPDMKMRADYSDGDIDWKESFYLLVHTLCPCVLTENGFMTNEKECRWLQTESALEALAQTHVDGINEYLSQ